ncbi:MAG: BamA/TamA family outer membrane protein [Myxococcota bacterium]
MPTGVPIGVIGSSVHLLLLGGLARAQAVPGAVPPGDGADPWWVGLPVAQVQLAAPEGGLPDESLEPLLRVVEGAPLDPHEVGLDLVTLFQVGEFSAVEANLEPWFIDGEGGDPQPSALLTYVVSPAPKIARVRVQGNRRFKDRELLGESGLAPGQVYYADLDGPFASDRLERWLYHQGYTRPSVQIRSTEPEPGQIYVVVVVDEGPPNTLERLAFTGDTDGVATDRQLRRWARKAGVAEGEPLAPDDVMRAQDAIREQLGSVQRRWFASRRGYVAARVTPAVVDTESGARITYAIEPGPRLDLVVTGLGWSGRRLVEDALGIDHRLRITRGFLDQAPDKLEAALQERGWLTAEASVTHDQPSDALQRLIVSVDRGPRHIIGDVPDLLRFVDFRFDLIDADDLGSRAARKERKALQAVFDQASPDILRRDFYTADAMATGIEAARQYYVDRGYLDATLEVEAPEIRRRRSLANLWRSVAGLDQKMRVTPRVQVERGPITTLTALEIEGGAPDVDLTAFVAQRADKIGGPYSPQQLDALARALVDAHREAGYLAADAKVQQTETAPHQRAAVVVVEPGTQVLLRSVVTRGARVTSPSFVQNVVDLDLGQPITSTSLEAIRSDLYDFGIFQSVGLTLLGDEEARDLLVTLDERPRWSFELAPGVSTDQGVRAYGRAVRRNLFGRAHQLELLGQVGFEFQSQDPRDWLLDLQNPEWRAAASYTAPRFPTRDQRLVLDVVLRERRQERTWQMDRSGGGAAIEWQLNRTRLRAGARLETRQLNEIDVGALLSDEAWARQIALAGPGGIPSRVQESVTGLVVEDLRDDPVRPRTGALLSLNLEWAPGLPWPNQPRTSFLKSDARVSGYVPVGGLTLHVAVGGGYIAPFSGLPPLEDRFRLGGTGSLRGFVRDAVGPQNLSPPLVVDWPNGIGPIVDYTLRDEPQRWTPTGGDTTANGVVELLMPLPALGLTGWDGYAAELFGDIGNVWLLDPAATADSVVPPYAALVPAVRYGVGAGIQVETPVGPLQFDVALNPQALFSEGAARALLVDGWREPVVRAHLTLGALW